MSRRRAQVISVTFLSTMTIFLDLWRPLLLLSTCILLCVFSSLSLPSSHYLITMWKKINEYLFPDPPCHSFLCKCYQVLMLLSVSVACTDCASARPGTRGSGHCLVCAECPGQCQWPGHRVLMLILAHRDQALIHAPPCHVEREFISINIPNKER